VRFVRQFLGMAVGDWQALIADSGLAQLGCPRCLTMGRPAFGFRHVYSEPPHLAVRRRFVGGLRQRFVGSLKGVMHDPANELRRITLPRTSVNKSPATIVEGRTSEQVLRRPF
jgi:hypothetical protein